MKAGLSQHEIAGHLERSEATIARELERNRGRRSYHPKQAQAKADDRKQNHVATRIKSEIWELVEQQLRLDFRPGAGLGLAQD